MPVKPIAALQGAATDEIQKCLAAFVERHRGELRIVGMIEVADDGACAEDCQTSRLRSIADGQEFEHFQDLGSQATSCALYPQGLVEAAQLVCRQIGEGCDLVVLSKFGKLEAENGSGLVPAFAAALEAGVPVLTSVSPRFGEAWSAFASPWFEMVPCNAAAVEDWWSAQGL